MGAVGPARTTKASASESPTIESDNSRLGGSKSKAAKAACCAATMMFWLSTRVPSTSKMMSFKDIPGGERSEARIAVLCPPGEPLATDKAASAICSRGSLRKALQIRHDAFAHIVEVGAHRRLGRLNVARHHRIDDGD